MVLPPLLPGAVNVTLACALPPVAVPIVGAPGTVAGVTLLDADDAAPVPAGTNRWIVGHGTPFRAVAGPPHLAEGEAVVIKPGNTRWTVVARITVADWDALGGSAHR